MNILFTHKKLKNLDTFALGDGTNTFFTKNFDGLVIKIRKSKLPDPTSIPNAGSFFKNPIVSKNVLTRILRKIPDIKFQEINLRKSNRGYKVPAGWMLESIGWEDK